MTRNVVLVGFSGSGKTTVGRELAIRLGLEFVDLDSAVEQKYHASIPHIFQKYGESVFRQCEYQTLMEKLAQSGLLIATGGGAPAFKDAMQQIKTHAFSVYLKLPEETLVYRLKNTKKRRPLTENLSQDELKEYVHETLRKRTPFYAMADLKVEEEKISIDEIALAISDYIL